MRLTRELRIKTALYMYCMFGTSHTAFSTMKLTRAGCDPGSKSPGLDPGHFPLLEFAHPMSPSPRVGKAPERAKLGI